MVVTRWGQVTQSSAPISVWIRPASSKARSSAARLRSLSSSARGPGECAGLALQDRGKGTDKFLAVGAGESAGACHVKLRAAQEGPGVGQWEDSVQRRQRLPHPQATKVGAEVLHVPRGPPEVLDGESGCRWPLVHPDVDHVFLAAQRPVPRWQGRLQQIAL
jgi:hypothetical protein